jgi:hypothetical protein
MADYTYLLFNSLTGTVMEELPLSEVVFELGLNGGGNMTAKMSLNDPKAAPDNLQTLSREIAVIRNGEPEWMGPIIALVVSMENNTIEITCAPVWWWMTKMTPELTLSYTATDLADICWDALYVTQGKVPGGDKHIERHPHYNATGQRATASWPGALRKPTADIISDLGSVYPGFDFGIELSWTLALDRIKRYFQTYTPFQGQDIDEPLNQYNGLIGFSYTEDGTSAITRVHEIGATTNNTVLLASMSDTDSDSGIPPSQQRGGTHIPMVEDTVSRTDVSQVSQLRLWAQGDLFLRHWPLRTYTATFRPNEGLPYGSITPGDRVLVDVVMGKFVVQTRLRVIKLSVSVTASGDETIDVTFNDPSDAAGG